MVKYLIDTNEKRDIVLFYTASNDKDFVYKEVFDEAVKKLGIKVFYFNTSKEGHASPEALTKYIPDFRDRTFYISGSHGVVMAFESILKILNIPSSQIVTDYFPGFA